MTPEGKVKAKVKAALKRYKPHVWYDMPVPSGFGKPTLDFIGSAWGLAFAIETKKPGGVPTPRQAQTIEDIEASHAQVFVIDGDNGQLEELETWLLLRAKTTLQSKGSTAPAAHAVSVNFGLGRARDGVQRPEQYEWQ